MQFKISNDECKEIFKSIDIDGGGTISLNEFVADMDAYRMDLDMLLAENQERRKEQKENENLNNSRLI